MARFFFDLTDGTIVLSDDEGVDARDVEHARTEAVQAAREMRASGELGVAADDWSLVIRDDAGDVVETIPLSGSNPADDL